MRSFKTRIDPRSVRKLNWHLGTVPNARDIHYLMCAGARLFPPDQARSDLHALTYIAVIDRQDIASQHHGYPLIWITMPSHSFSGGKSQKAHYYGSVMKRNFVDDDDLIGIRFQPFAIQRK